MNGAAGKSSASAFLLMTLAAHASPPRPPSRNRISHSVTKCFYLDEGQDAIGKVINDAIRVCGQRWVMRVGIASRSKRYFPLGRYWFDDSFAYRFSTGRR